jgi:basic membrane protein A
MKKLYAILSVMIVMAFMLGACGTDEEATEEPAPPPPTAVEPTEEHEDEHVEEPTAEPMADVTPVTVCFVTDLAGVDDRSFNALGWKGVNDAVAAGYANADPILLESDAAEDYQPNIDGCLAQGAEHIVTSGFAMQEVVKANAPENPDVLWTFIDASGFALDNVRELVYQTDEAAFVAGYVAAGTTQTGVLGTYGGANFPTVSIFMDGFTRGAAYYNEQNGTDVQVVGWNVEAGDGVFTGSFTDMALARTTCEGLLDEGADILIPVGGAINLPCGDAIIARGVDGALVGVDADAFFAMPDIYQDLWLTTVEKGIDIQVTRSIQAHAEGTWTPGGTLGTAANGAIGLSEFHSWDAKIPDNVKAEAAALFQSIIDGEFDAAFTEVQ